jgi:hypothetical protein
MYQSSFNDCHYISSDDISRQIASWTCFIKQFTNEGWDAYLVSVLFHKIAGSMDTKKAQMNQETERIYNRLGTRMVRKTWSPKWARYLPIGIFVPDFPVPKSKGKKSSIEDVSINDGLHMGGILLGNKWGKVREGLERHFNHEKEVYQTGKIRNINIAPITHDLEDAVDYTFKSLKRRSCGLNDVQVLNWGGSAPAAEATRRWMMRAFP